MGRLPLGRLFWKFLLFFFLAQTTAVLGVGLAIWATHRDHPPPPPPRYEVGRCLETVEVVSQPQGCPPPGDSRREPPPRGPRPPIAHLVTGAIVSLIFAALLAAYVSRPIQRLRRALRAGAAGQLRVGVSAEMGSRRDELADLGEDFDRMARHLVQLMAGQRELLHNVSHELRSPLARLSAIVSLARQQPGALDDCLTRLERESERMDRLLAELLELSRLDSGTETIVFERVDIGELLAAVVDDAAPLAEQAGCRLDLASAADVCVQGEPRLLYRVFDNLVRNALSHAAQGGWVGLKLVSAGAQVTVTIEDRGPGVPAAEVDRLFVPFFRGQESTGRSGHGLGLAIAERIVARHGGTIVAANRSEGGLRVTVVLREAPALT